jgi:intraflagellar transport protein 74
MESAMSMQENSTEERKLRQAELDKMNNLEMKIQSELESLDSKMERMREEKKQYAKLDELRDSAERRGKQLENEKEALQRQSEMLDVVVGQKKQEYEAKCVQLADNDTHNQVEKLQERLMMLGQGIYQTRRDVEAKERENQHGELSKQVLETCESLNRLNNASAS